LKQATTDALPTQLVSDAFAGGTATLDGRVSTTGQPWDTVLGTLQVTGGQARCTTCSAGNYGAALIDADLAQVTASVDLRLTGGAGTPGTAGVVMNANQAGTQGIVVWWDANVVRLFRYSGGGLTQLAQGAAAGLSTGADRTLVVTYTAGTYAVSFNGASVFNVTLSAGDQATFGSNTYFGIVFQNDPDRIRLDDFQVTK
jgi:hypothetical protein